MINFIYRVLLLLASGKIQHICYLNFFYLIIDLNSNAHRICDWEIASNCLLSLLALG